MKRILFFSTILLGTFITSCGSDAPVDHSNDVDLGKIEGNNYTCDEIGWETSYPETWKITSKKSLEALDESSQRASGQDIKKNKDLKRLLAYQLDFNNSFQSTIETYKGKTAEDYHKAKKNVRESVYVSYFDAGIRVDTSASTYKSGNITFDVFQLNLYNREGEAYAHQVMYTAIIKDYYFTAVIAYDEEKYKEKMQKSIAPGTFK